MADAARAGQRQLPRGRRGRPPQAAAENSLRRCERAVKSHGPDTGAPATPPPLPRAGEVNCRATGLPSLRPPPPFCTGVTGHPTKPSGGGFSSSLLVKRMEPEPARSLLPARGSHYYPVVPGAPRPAPKPGQGGRARGRAQRSPSQCRTAPTSEALVRAASSATSTPAARSPRYATPPVSAALLPPTPTARHSRKLPPPPPSRSPVFKGARQTC